MIFCDEAQEIFSRIQELKGRTPSVARMSCIVRAFGISFALAAQELSKILHEFLNNAGMLVSHSLSGDDAMTMQKCMNLSPEQADILTESSENITESGLKPDDIIFLKDIQSRPYDYVEDRYSYGTLTRNRAIKVKARLNDD